MSSETEIMMRFEIEPTSSHSIYVYRNATRAIAFKLKKGLMVFYYVVVVLVVVS